VNLQAQFTSATLTGVVSDRPARLCAGKVKLVNEKTHDTRETITNNDGYYTFIGMAVGDFSYGLTVEAKGFVTYDARASRCWAAKGATSTYRYGLETLPIKSKWLAWPIRSCP